MRLFVSLRPPAEARQHLAGALAGARMTDVAQWHLTVVFLGEVPDPEPLLPGLRDAAASVRPLRLRLTGGRRFGQRLLAAGVGGDVDGLHTLARRVRAASRAAGVRVERRPYRPHLSVARGAPAALLAGYEGPEWVATEIELVRSQLGARAVHTVLETLPLGTAE